MSGLQLVVVLILMGGLIAFLGDRIGMRVGRRRLTLFGMRPKHSSVVVTVLTGTLIAALSLGALTIVSNDVRTALFRMKEIQTNLAQTHEALVASERELEGLRRTLSGHREEVEEIASQRDQAIQERDAARSEKAALTDEIDSVTDQLGQARADLEEWKSRVASLRELSETLEDAIAKMQVTETRLRADITTLTEQYLALEGRLRSGEFVYLKDEIVAATVLTVGEDRTKVEERLLQLLEEADRVALARGARIDGKERAIELGREEYFFQAANVLTSQEGEWVARVVAMQNTVQGEALQAYFHLYPKTLVYEEGEVIVERVLDGGRQDSENALLALLDDVNHQALVKGMITTEDGQVGHVAGEAFVEALLALRRSGGTARVAAVATEDTWNTEGPLNIELVVSPQGNGRAG